jgi:hypothetical protein
LSTTAAHELGHAQGLDDIYSIDLYGGVTPLDQTVTSNWLPKDWTSGPANNGYYQLGLRETDLIKERLIMNGLNRPKSALDIPNGTVYGFHWYTDPITGQYTNSACTNGKVGVDGATNTFDDR